jgi:hypothetical protein
MAVVAVAGFALLATGAAYAAPQDFTLTNNTGYTIRSVYISPHDEDDWGSDVMGSDELDDDADVDIHFPSGRSQTCIWDLKVAYDDGTTAEWDNFNLCTISSIQIDYDHDTGKTWATWR